MYIFKKFFKVPELGNGILRMICHENSLKYLNVFLIFTRKQIVLLNIQIN